MLVNLRTIPSRLGSSAVAIIGIAGVVIVFVSVLSISAGYSVVMADSCTRNRALQMRTGVDTELTRNRPGPRIRISKEAPGVRREVAGSLPTEHLYMIVDHPKKVSPESPANVPIRGIEPV